MGGIWILLQFKMPTTERHFKQIATNVAPMKCLLSETDGDESGARMRWEGFWCQGEMGMNLVLR